MSSFDIDFTSNKTTRPFLRRGQGKRISNRKSDINHEYLKKGEGKLVSQFHGETKFAEQRKQKIIDEQFEREKIFHTESEDTKSDDE